MSIWSRRAVTAMETDGNEKLVVITPGRKDVDGGCDFRDAVFLVDNEVKYGNVEVHVRSGDWYRHGHHLDTNYNSIALHVVMWEDVPSPVRLQNGKRVPTVCLSRYLTGSALEKTGEREVQPHSCDRYTCPGTKNGIDTSYLYRLLLKAGKRRLREKAGLIADDLKDNCPEQVLLKYIARAMGYRKNSVPFERLAGTFYLNRPDRPETGDSVLLQGLLFGIAGLLPSQRTRGGCHTEEDPEVERLETVWQESGIRGTMVEDEWCFFRIRPVNCAPRRIAALSILLERFHATGFVHGMLRLLPEVPDSTIFRDIEKSLMIAPQGYWGGHHDFGVSMARESVLLGRGKVREMVINTLLPFMYAWYGLQQERKRRASVIKVFSAYPMAGDNQLTGHMKQLLFHRPDIKLYGAQQQGLLHIFHRYDRIPNFIE
jgi:hypothetical protein